MQGKVSREQSAATQVYVGIDICKDWLASMCTQSADRLLPRFAILPSLVRSPVDEADLRGIRVVRTAART
jgi:hypothetical protein